MNTKTGKSSKTVVESEVVETLVEAPKMTVAANEPQEVDLIGDELLMGLYTEVLSNTRTDRKSLESYIDTFADMVVNDGDASAASKEAFVTLWKIKTDLSDKMTKILDLMTRIKLRDRDTMPKYLAAQQHNVYNIGTGKSKKDVIARVEKQLKQKQALTKEISDEE